MDLGLSRKERNELRADLAAAEPLEETGYQVYDGSIRKAFGIHRNRPPDYMKRWKASMAKKLLEQDEREKRAAGLPLEPESTPASERRARQEAAKKHP